VRTERPQEASQFLVGERDGNGEAGTNQQKFLLVPYVRFWGTRRTCRDTRVSVAFGEKTDFGKPDSTRPIYEYTAEPS
jgi:hypothetical protein